MKMLCPMRGFKSCVKSKCAWWNEDMREPEGGDCAMRSLCRIDLWLNQATDTQSNSVMVKIKES